MHPTAGAGVFTLGVLAHDQPVDVLGRDVGERRFEARQDARRADVGVLVEALADGEAKLPEADVIGYARIAGRAEVDGIEGLELIGGALRHHAAVGDVVIAAPGEARERQLEAAGALREGGQHLLAGGNDLLADAVAGNGRDAVRAHDAHPCFLKGWHRLHEIGRRAMATRPPRGFAAPQDQGAFSIILLNTCRVRAPRWRNWTTASAAAGGARTPPVDGCL